MTLINVKSVMLTDLGRFRTSSPKLGEYQVSSPPNHICTAWFSEFLISVSVAQLFHAVPSCSLGISTPTKIPPISYTNSYPLGHYYRRLHRIACWHCRKDTRITHFESAHSVNTGALVHHSAFLATCHATGATADVTCDSMYSLRRVSELKMELVRSMGRSSTDCMDGEMMTR
jgi:hypothetical protein